MGFTLAEAIVYFKGDDKQLDDAQKESKGKTESWAGEVTNVIKNAFIGGAAIAGTAILTIGGKAFDVAKQIDAATDQIGASLGLTDTEAKKFGATIKTVYGDNFGDSIEDVGKSIENVAKQLRLTADDPALVKVTENAYRLKDVFGVEVNDSIDAVKTLMEKFGITADEAFDHLTAGYQRGLDRSGDFLDTIGEYSVQFAEGGASVTEFFSALDTGLQGGVLGTDKAADAFKEFRVRIQDGSTLTAQSLEQIGLNADDITSKLNDGSITVKDAWDMVQRALIKTTDAGVQFQAGVGLIGTQFEDMGAKAVLAMDLTNDWADGGLKATSELDSKYTNLGSVAEGMWRKFEVGIAPAGEAILGFVNDNLPAVQELVDGVSSKIVEFIQAIPVALTEMHTKWDNDWAGIRSTWTEFKDALPNEQAAFWAEWNRTFDTGSGENQTSWEDFFRAVFGTVTGYGTLIIENWTLTLAIIGSSWRAFTAIFRGDWQSMWSETYTFWNSITDEFLNVIEFSFGADLRNAFAGALNGIWDTLASWWDTLKSWYNSTIGSIPGMTQLSGSPDFAIVNPDNVRRINQINSGGSGGFGGDEPQAQAQGNTTINNITVNQQNGSYEQGWATVDGVLDAMRFRGQ